MKVRIGRTNYEVFAFDFETHNDEESIANNTSGVWLGSMINESSVWFDENIYFYNLEQFFEKMRSKECNLLLYAYNLSFEWSFILPYLLEKGYQWKSHLKERDNDLLCYSSVTTHSVSSVWSATVTLGNGYKVMFRDLAKIYNGGLSAMAKSFHLETLKGEIDYRKNRLHNYKVTSEEKRYNFDDNKIVVEVLQKNINDIVFWKSCSSSTYALINMLNFGYPRSKNKLQALRKDYPAPTFKEYNFLRKTVAGGITYAPERWQFKNVKGLVKHIDAHQMHPTQGYFHLFPYGKGFYGTGKPPILYGNISAVHIRVSYNGVKLHSVIKCIGINAIDNAELWLWDFEIPTMKKCYNDLKIEYIDYYTYKSKLLPWREFYAENYKKRNKAKTQGDNYNYKRYKLLNNGSYGKLLEKAHNEIYENIISTDGVITSRTHLPKEEKLCAKYTVLQVGSCIPAYSRVNLIETALLFGYKNILYFDTDSIFYLDNEETRNALKKVTIGDFLGTWGIEPDITRFQATAPKRYKMVLSNGDIDVKIAGVNTVDTTVPFDEINITSKKYKVKRAYRCIGGTLINFQEKEIGVQSKYEEIYNRNK